MLTVGRPNLPGARLAEQSQLRKCSFDASLPDGLSPRVRLFLEPKLSNKPLVAEPRLCRRDFLDRFLTADSSRRELR